VSQKNATVSAYVCFICHPYYRSKLPTMEGGVTGCRHCDTIPGRWS